MNIHGFDSLNICWIRTNHAWISDEWWEMNRLMCLFCVSEKFVLEPWWTWWMLMNFVSRTGFDPWECVIHALHVFLGYLNMYWSSASLAWHVNWWISVWPSHVTCWPATRLMKRRVSCIKRASFWIMPHFDSRLQHLFKWHCILSHFPPCYSYYAFHVFLFFLSLHKFINKW